MSKSKIIVIKGVANVIRHFSPTMIRQQSGVIANFSSEGDAALMQEPLLRDQMHLYRCLATAKGSDSGRVKTLNLVK